ncbi:MAG: hypothetical protein AB8G16_07685 [Gammaproteobacteria bacterium]
MMKILNTMLMKRAATVLLAGVLTLGMVSAEAGPGRASGAKPGKPSTSQPRQSNPRVKQLQKQARGQWRSYASARAKQDRAGARVDRARIIETGARRSYETLVKTRGERSPEARQARRTLDSSRANRANLESSLDTARGQAREAKRRHREAGRALSRARRGDWAGANRASSRINQKARGRARKITFASTVQVFNVSMAPEVVAARKGQLKPNKK